MQATQLAYRRLAIAVAFLLARVALDSPVEHLDLDATELLAMNIARRLPTAVWCGITTIKQLVDRNIDALAQWSGMHNHAMPHAIIILLSFQATSIARVSGVCLSHPPQHFDWAGFSSVGGCWRCFCIGEAGDGTNGVCNPGAKSGSMSSSVGVLKLLSRPKPRLPNCQATVGMVRQKLLQAAYLFMAALWRQVP